MPYTEYELKVAKSIKEQGGTEADFREWQNSQRNISKKEEPWMLSKIKNNFTETISDVEKNLEKRWSDYYDLVNSSQDSLWSIALQGAWIASWAIGDVLWWAIWSTAKTADIATWENASGLIKDIAKSDFRKWVWDVWNYVSWKYWEFEQAYPEAWRDVRAVGNIANILPAPKTVSAIMKWWSKIPEIIWSWVDVAKQEIKDIVPKIWKTINTGVESGQKWAWTLTKSIISSQSGIWTPTVESILRNPELQWKIRSWELSWAQTLDEAKLGIDQVYRDLSETGRQYDTVRNLSIVVPKSEIKNTIFSQLESEGLSSGWKLNLVDLPVKDRGAIQQAVKYINEYGENMTPKNALSIRQKLDDLISYKSDVGSNGERIVKWLRAKIDEYLWEKLPWLKEIDAEYAPERQFWSQIRRDIYNKDWTVKDNALSIISNITNKGNEARLTRMEKILPWIWEKVKALRAFEDIQSASGIKVWTYLRNSTTWWLALTGNIIPAIALWVWTHPVVVWRLLEAYGIAKKRIQEILKKWKNISWDDAKVLHSVIQDTPPSKVENILNSLSYNPTTNELTSGNTSKKVTVKNIMKNR